MTALSPQTHSPPPAADISTHKPRNLIILGTGRSGTSMLTRMFSTSHYCGDDYISPRECNPTGFFEDSRVNHLNNRLVWRHACICLPARLRLPGQPANRDISLLWLATPSSSLHLGAPKETDSVMRELISQQPFCYKDPRFSYTLRFWEPFLPPDTGRVVVFRQRSRTVASMQRELDEAYAKTNVTDEYLTHHWNTSYRRLLSASQKNREQWFFLSYDDLLSGAAIPSLERFTNSPLDASHIDQNRSRTAGVAKDDEACVIYDKLVEESKIDLKRFE